MLHAKINPDVGTAGFFLTKNKNSRRKKLLTAKTQGKFCSKNQGFGAFSKFTYKRKSKYVVKNRDMALFWPFHFKFFIIDLKSTLKSENFDIFYEKNPYKLTIFAKTEGFFF